MMDLVCFFSFVFVNLLLVVFFFFVVVGFCSFFFSLSDSRVGLKSDDF